LGVRSPDYASPPEHFRDIILTVERAGFQKILIPSGYNSGIDVWTLAAFVARELHTLRLLTAVRVGELHAPMFARAAANLGQMLGGRLNINTISSPLVGLPEQSSDVRYRRTEEFIKILRQFWTREHVSFKGEFYNFDLAVEMLQTVQRGEPPDSRVRSDHSRTRIE
jgi:alkanesulfonate monooxygenase